MTVSSACTVLLALLVFGLGAAVSLLRLRTRTTHGHVCDPRDPLYKVVRAHGNAAEYAPMLAILYVWIGSRDPAPGLLALIAAATLFRFLHAGGLALAPTLDNVFPPRGSAGWARAVGAIGTYVCGPLLALGALFA